MPAAIPAAIAVAGTAASVAGSAMQAGAAGDAASAQGEAAEQAAKIARQQYRDDITYSWPWYSGGVAAQNQMLNLMGLGSTQTADTATGTAGNYVDPATAMVEAAKIREAIRNQIQGNRGLSQSENKLARLQQQQARFTAQGRPDKAAALQGQIDALKSTLATAAAAPQYDLSGIKNPNQILNRMTDLELYRAFGPNGQYAPQSVESTEGSEWETAPVYGSTGAQQAAEQAAAIRSGLIGQVTDDKRLPQMQNQLARLQQQYERLAERGGNAAGRADRLTGRIGDLQSSIDAMTADNTYDVSSLTGRNLLREIQGMSDDQIYSMFSSPEEYAAWVELGQKPAEIITPGIPATTEIGDTATPVDTSQTGLQQSALQMFQTDPGYLFRLREGEKAILRNKAATGGAQSGATLKALERYAQDYASGEYANYYNRLASLAGRGSTTQTNNSSIGTNVASNVGGNVLAGGQARASGYINQGNAWAGGLQNAMQGIGSAIGSSAGGGGNYGGWGSSGFPYASSYQY